MAINSIYIFCTHLQFDLYYYYLRCLYCIYNGIYWAANKYSKNSKTPDIDYNHYYHCCSTLPLLYFQFIFNLIHFSFSFFFFILIILMIFSYNYSCSSPYFNAPFPLINCRPSDQINKNIYYSFRTFLKLYTIFLSFGK